MKQRRVPKAPGAWSRAPLRPVRVWTSPDQHHVDRLHQAKEALIDTKKHVVLKAAHPSGLSASRGFYGCKHFSKANEAIKKVGGAPIDWQIEP